MTSLPSNHRTQAFIDGQLVDAEDGALLDTPNPATGGVLTRIAACSEADVDRAVAAARAAFRSGVWSRIDPTERKKVLLAFADKIAEHAEELALLDSIDAGKPITDCRTLDLPDVENNIRWYAEAIDKIYGKISTTGEGNLGLIQRDPLGVIGMVLPWNFPLGTLSWKIAPALAAGNSIVVKPAELASLSTIRLAELAVEAGIPNGVFNVTPGAGTVAGRALGLHPDVDMLTFTGSTAVGRQFLRYAADSNLKNIVLECGGKSPQIVFPSVVDRLDDVAANLAGAAFWNMGQNCTCGSRILVHREIADAFTKSLVAQAATWTVGQPTDPEAKMGPLVEAKALARVMDAIETAKNAGAAIAHGGTRVLEETGGWFVAPTVVTDVTPEMEIAQKEIFGPVVAVIPFDTEEEAIEMANASEYGLAATVFSTDISQALRVSRRIQAGTVAVNGYGEGNITTPFGGYKSSGFGGYDKGLEAFDQYTHLRTIWITITL